MSGRADAAITDITDRLRQEFRVRDWWPGMDSFDSARGETVPHPIADEAAAVIEALRHQITITQDRAVELDFAAERALEMLQSGRHFDAEDTLARVLGSGSNRGPSR